MSLRQSICSGDIIMHKFALHSLCLSLSYSDGTRPVRVKTQDRPLYVLSKGRWCNTTNILTPGCYLGLLNIKTNLGPTRDSNLGPPDEAYLLATAPPRQLGRNIRTYTHIEYQQRYYSACLTCAVTVLCGVYNPFSGQIGENQIR
ncbi:unnamed protein product, partial [Brenthis ino]